MNEVDSPIGCLTLGIHVHGEAYVTTAFTRRKLLLGHKSTASTRDYLDKTG